MFYINMVTLILTISKSTILFAIVEGNNMAFIIAAQEQLQNTIKLNFEVEEDAEYYSLKISNKLMKLDIISIDISDGNTTKNIPVNYNLWPYNYAKSLEQVKYDKTSVSSRLEIYKLCIDILKDNLLLGHGFDYFKIASSKTSTLDHVLVEHSQVMALGVQNGIFGIITWIILIIVILLNCITKLSKENLPIIMVLLLLIYSSIYDFSMSYHFFLLLFFSYSIILLNKKDTKTITKIIKKIKSTRKN